jgi:hypothetical protein
MSTLTRFDPPGFLNDFNDAQRGEWSKYIFDQFEKARNAEDRSLRHHGPRLRFFNPLSSPPDADSKVLKITWTAFPRIVTLDSVSDLGRWRRADSSRDRQDEYCEWSVSRERSTGKILRVTFTTEGPEYWDTLAFENMDKILSLYQEHVSSAVRMQDLFPSGPKSYNSRNIWNSTTSEGAMHLIQNNNTLKAEIELAAAASIVRTRGGVLLTNEQELIACGKYGQANRHSDPRIGSLVNEIARQKADVTLANPVGVYIDKLSVSGWVTPDNSNPLSYWKITRGTQDYAVRAVFEVPPGQGFTVGDIRINGQVIDFGAQIADYITIKLVAVATRFGQRDVSAFPGCVEEIGISGVAPGATSVATILDKSRSGFHR